MAILIDGYNLLSATGIVGPRSRPGSFSGTRSALINFVAQAVDPADRSATAIVFDAGNAPPGLPNRFEHRGVTVLFSRGYEDADAMIEALIRADSAPRKLTVVSSDHRIQRAARRRRAHAVDSGVWYAERWRALRSQTTAAAPADPRPPVPLSAEEVAAWLQEFGDIDVEKLQAELSAKESAPAADAVETQPPPVDPRSLIKPGEESCLPQETAAGPAPLPSGNGHPPHGQSLPSDSIYNPFPPGYAEELLEDPEAKDRR